MRLFAAKNAVMPFGGINSSAMTGLGGGTGSSFFFFLVLILEPINYPFFPTTCLPIPTVRFFPFLVRAFVFVLWPFTGRPLRCRKPR